MLPFAKTHEDYQRFVLDKLQYYYSEGGLTLLARDWPIMTKCWITDLSSTIDLVEPTYGKRGPRGTDPACLLRSYLVMLLTHPTSSIDKWVDELRRVPLYAIISGFEPGCTPGVGTFYDFFRRLWNLETPNVRKHQQRKKRKPKKGKKKGDKAPTTSPGKVKRLLKRFMRFGSSRKSQPFDKLFDLFQSQFLTFSAKLGLLGDLDHLNIAGDGTPIVTSVYSRSRSLCDCRAQGLRECDHPRFYSQPDCDFGWDSAREKYFSGYHLYQFTASDSQYDLPLFPRLHPASRHDAISFAVSFVEFSQRSTLGTVDKVILDAAHDAGAIYDFLIHHHHEPIIDLNSRTNASVKKGDIEISSKGIPICPAGLEMKSNGFDQARYRHKWRCPLASGTKISCENPCSTAKYGRTFYTNSKDNPRLFPKIARNTEQWKKIFNTRTSVERTNKREKIDYHLEAGNHRSSMLWYIRIYGIMMCQHMDAWYLHLKDEFDIKKIIFG
ncbi:transposase [Camelliibacillus cellulosilyticus]|uniref:Transposase n=1 Tax=Camelliibacillus cellulosilyticus TaxID=2174486 RepID=A0ABV9GTH2_9BACL